MWSDHKTQAWSSHLIQRHPRKARLLTLSWKYQHLYSKHKREIWTKGTIVFVDSFWRKGSAKSKSMGWRSMTSLYQCNGIKKCNRFRKICIALSKAIFQVWMRMKSSQLPESCAFLALSLVDFQYKANTFQQCCACPKYSALIAWWYKRLYWFNWEWQQK